MNQIYLDFEHETVVYDTPGLKSMEKYPGLRLRLPAIIAAIEGDKEESRRLVSAIIDRAAEHGLNMDDLDYLLSPAAEADAARIAQSSGISLEAAQAMIEIGLRDTRRDEQGRLLADADDIAEPGEWLTEGEE